MNTYNVTEFSKRIGVSVKTLQRWDRQGKLKPIRSPTNRRLYTDDHLAQVISRPTQHARLVIVYVRVSSQAQKPDLVNQRTTLEQFCLGRGLIVDEWVSEIGGGLNFKRPKFLSLIDRILTGQVGTLIVAHKDRLVRFGFDLLQHLCRTHGCTLLVLNTETLSPEQEMVQDLMAIIHCFSARLYGLRNYRKALQKALTDATSAQDPSESDT
jgi:putative resolvase